MSIQKLLIANRGEIAIRIARSAAELGIATVAVYSEDDADSRHRAVTDEAAALPDQGPAAYLQAEAVLAAAREHHCDAIHPGYGFLSENAAFAAACEEQGFVFVGPRPEALALFGDKAKARQLAQELGVPVLTGTDVRTSLEEARAFLERADGPIMIKALAGGGGRGMQIVRSAEELESAYRRCAAEAKAAFGDEGLYVERFLAEARHIEIQILGDGGEVAHLWERECSLQRRNQKLIEIAPSPSLSAALRDRLIDAALTLARHVQYRGLGTFEFLIDADGSSFAFIEANPRLQVEHTVTEEITGVDLVQAQLRLAAGASLDALGLQSSAPPPLGYAMQLRVNTERMEADGSAKPSAGTLSRFELPSGPGVRVDTYGYAGYTTNPRFDSLLAKLIVSQRSARFVDTVTRAKRALAEFRIDGIVTNLPFLQALLERPELAENRIHTRLIDALAPELVARLPEDEPVRALQEAEVPHGWTAVCAPMQGVVVELSAAEGDAVAAGAQLAVIEAMKMQHVVTAPVGGLVRHVAARPGAPVDEGAPLALLEEADVAAQALADDGKIDLDTVRPDLAEVLQRHAAGLDAARPEAVAKRRKTGQRTARENIEDLCDPGSFTEYGALALAAQRRRRSEEELIRMSPADGLVAGLASINADRFGHERARCMVMSYDYTVFAGTQGMMNHKKTDRLFKLAEDWRLPIVIFAEGGGGRPGDTDSPHVAGLDVPTFRQYARLSGLVPRIAIVSGRCFAGNAALAGCSDVLIATENATLGMGGPAMIEGGGLGVYRPEDVGPVAMQAPNGVIDLVVADEAEAVQAAKQLLSYFQGATEAWECADQRLLRRSIPENRLRAYDIHALIETLADRDSVLELRRGFAPGMITAFVRIEGRPLGLIANNPMHLAGAIDSDAADKAARFMQLCDAFDIPLLTLCDTPGIMVGPDAERTALVRHAARLFVTAASLSVPVFTLVLRKGYGLGAQVMAGGSFHAPVFIAAWPSGEFGGMGLEGAVRLGYRRELEAVTDPVERQALFEKMVAQAYERGKAINMAAHLEIDAVIDPAESRAWIMRGLRSVPKPAPGSGKKRPMVDTW